MWSLPLYFIKQMKKIKNRCGNCYIYSPYSWLCTNSKLISVEGWNDWELIESYQYLISLPLCRHTKYTYTNLHIIQMQRECADTIRG